MAKKCKDCQSFVAQPYYFVKFKRSKLGQPEKGKVMVCKECFNGWKNHQSECRNPPEQCFTVVKQKGNMLFIVDNRVDAEKYQHHIVNPIPYYDL